MAAFITQTPAFYDSSCLWIEDGTQESRFNSPFPYKWTMNMGFVFLCEFSGTIVLHVSLELGAMSLIGFSARLSCC